MFRRIVLAAVFAASLVAVPAVAHALVAPLSLAEITALSNAVVEVRITAASPRSAQSPSGRTMPVTDVQARVTRTFLGSRPVDFTLTQPGGTVGDVTLMVPDMPDFTPGERCVLFLGKGGVIAGDRGKLEIIDGSVPELGMSLIQAEETIAGLVAGRAVDLPPLPGAQVSSLASALGIAGGEVVVAGDVGVTAVTGVAPDRANAGVGDVITITGSGFGAVRGTGSVSFLRGDEQDGTRVAATVYPLWSDTEVSCEVPAFAQGGTIRVTTDSGTVFATAVYDIGFSTTGITVADSPLVYRINENTPDVVGEGAAIEAALTTWNEAGSNFRAQRSATPGTRTQYPPDYDGVNDVFFVTDPEFGTGYLAVNYLWVIGDTILETDIVFSEAADWYIGAALNRFDIESIALHELGHAVGLDDQYSEYDEVMGAASDNNIRRDLSLSEIEGAVYLYGPDATSPPRAPAITSSTHGSQTTWVSNPSPAFAFSVYVPIGVGGYSYALDQAASTVPDMVSEGSDTATSFAGFADGEHYFHVRAVSATDVWGAAAHYRVRVDTTPPASVVSVPATSSLSARATLSATDARSGVANMYYRLDGGAAALCTGSITVSALGMHTLSYWSVDLAGNVEVARQVSFEVLPRDEVDVVPVEGPDRFATAVETSKLGFASGASSVLIATGRNWPDALGASALAGALDAPILLVEKDTIPAAVASEIGRLGATRAIIIGGTGAVSSTVQTALGWTGRIANVERISGADRYDTARRVATRAVEEAGSEFDGTLLVATGGSYADALAASPASAARRWPILLVAPGRGLDDATRVLAYSIGARAVVLGGTAAVSDLAFSDLKSLFGSGAVERIAGADRFDTASRAATWGVSDAGLSFASPAVATGRSPYDALVGGVVQGRDGSVLLLTEPTVLPASTASVIAANQASVVQVRFLGGTSAVSQTVRDQVVAYFE